MLIDTVEKNPKPEGAPTEVKAQAQALRHLESMLTCAPFGFLFLDRDLRYVRINDQLAEMHGYSIAAHLGKTVAEIVPSREATVREVTARILATGQPVLDHEFTGQTAREPGVARTWNESWYPARDEHGETIGFSAMVVDITERKKADAALRANTALFSKIIEQAPGGGYVLDAQFRVVQMNAESLPFFASVQPLIGRDFGEALGILWGPEIGPQIASIFRHTLATGERYVSPRFSEQRQDIGVVQAFEWEVQRITLPDGQHGVVCYFMDVTERERAQAARRDGEERLRLAIAGSDLGTWHWDICTGELDWSERCMEIFGIPAGTAMSYDKFLGTVHPEDRARVDDAVQHALQECSEYRIEYSNVWPDGSVHWAVSLGRVYCDAAGKPIRMEGIALDITERKRTEAALRETERNYRALAEASAEIPYRMSADWSTMLPLDGHGLFASSDRPISDWAWMDQYLPPGEQARVRQLVSDAIAQKKLFEMEHRVVRADRSTGWTRSRAVPILDENDDLVTWFGAASDITERKVAEEALRESEERLQKAISVPNVGVLFFKLDGHMLNANAALQRMSGYTAEELRRITDWAQLTPPEFMDVTRRAAAELAESGATAPYEKQWIRKDGSRFWGLFSPTRLSGSGSESECVEFTIDITQTKRAEEQLRMHRQLLETVVNDLPAAVALIRGRDLTFQMVNPGYQAISPGKQMIGKTIAEVWPENMPLIAQRCRRVLETGEPFEAVDERYEIRRDSDGPLGTAYFSWSMRRVHLPDEAQPGLLLTIWETTARKEIELALAERTALLSGVLEGTTDVIFVKDLNGGMLLVNAAFAAAAGSTPELLVGKTDADWFPPDVAAAVRQQDEAVIAGGSPMEFEESLPVAGEERVFLTLKAPLRDGGGRVVGLLGIGRDITERKRIEKNLIETTAAAEQANRAKSDFLSSMSHELRTPLNAILGFAQLLESGTPAPTPAQRRNLEQIIKGGWYLLELVNDLLDLAQIESGSFSLTQEPVSLAEVMLECRAMIEPQASERAITITLPSLELPGTVRADRTRLKQVVINLLSNAVKYNKAHGAVTVEFALSPPDVVRVSVRDTGEGLAPEQLAQLFQPFNRLGREAGPEQGTGIGLVMSRHIVESMGGAIGVQSVVGVGSVFWFELKWA